jgi:hypothetical protein
VICLSMRLSQSCCSTMWFYCDQCIPNIGGKHKKFALIGIFFI